MALGLLTDAEERMAARSRKLALELAAAEATAATWLMGAAELLLPWPWLGAIDELLLCRLREADLLVAAAMGWPAVPVVS